MTEEEAKQKWCPLARPMTEHFIEAGTCGAIGMTSFNRLPGNSITTGVQCIGSACMAWRVSAPEWIVDEKTEMEIKTRNRVGYCGAFGKP